MDYGTHGFVFCLDADPKQIISDPGKTSGFNRNQIHISQHWFFHSLFRGLLAFSCTVLITGVILLAVGLAVENTSRSSSPQPGPSQANHNNNNSNSSSILPQVKHHFSPAPAPAPIKKVPVGFQLFLKNKIKI